MASIFAKWFDFLDLLRLDRWFNKLEVTFVCGAIILLTHPIDEPFKPIAYFTAFNLVFYPYLYLINSVCEREEDLKGGKDIYYGFSHRSAIWMTVFFGIATLALSFYPQRPGTALIGILVFIAATVYSLEPIHLKRRGLWGVFNGPFYQRVLPFLFFVSLLDVYPARLVAYLTLWLFASSFEVFLLHELKDYRADLAANVQTYVVKVGEQKAHAFRDAVHIAIIGYGLLSFALFDFYTSVLLCLTILVFKFKNGHVNYRLKQQNQSVSQSPTSSAYIGPGMGAEKT